MSNLFLSNPAEFYVDLGSINIHLSENLWVLLVFSSLLLSGAYFQYRIIMEKTKKNRKRGRK